MRFLGVLLLLAGSAYPAEYVIFASGHRLHVDRHETEGGKVRLFVGGAVTELDASRVAGYEADDSAPPASSLPAEPDPADAAEQLPARSPEELADDAADKYGLPRWLVRSVMAAESGFRQSAVSPKGAVGLMQLMPSTAKDLGVNPHDPVQNVDGGARYLRGLLLKYDSRLWPALAAYNAGPGAVDKYKGVPPYAETVDYILRIDRLGRRFSLPTP